MRRRQEQDRHGDRLAQQQAAASNPARAASKAGDHHQQDGGGKDVAEIDKVAARVKPTMRHGAGLLSLATQAAKTSSARPAAK